MYELVLSNQNVVSNITPIMLDQNVISLANVKDDEKDAIDVIDVEFTTGLKRAEKNDYIFALFSGSLACAIHKVIVNSLKINLDLKELKKEDIPKIVSIILKAYDYSDKNAKSAEKKIDDFINNAANTVNKAPKYKEMAKDFAKGLSYKALAMSIIDALLVCEIGKDKDGKFVINKIEDEVLENASITKRIQIGFIKWLVEETYQYKKTGKFKEQAKDVVKIRGGLSKIEAIIKDLADTHFFKDKDFNKTKTCRYFISEINKFDNEPEFDDINLKRLLDIQLIPIIINKALVRTYYLVKIFAEEVNKHNTKTIEGLEILQLAKEYNSGKNAIRAMDDVATTIFTAIDVTVSLGVATKAGVTVGVATYATSENAIKAALKGVATGAAAFASTININNAIRFVAVVREDKQFILDDVKALLNKPKEIKIKQYDYKKLTNEEIDNLLGLNKVETKMLYSLELQLVNNDIACTKESKDQIRKNKWKKQWMQVCEDSLGLHKLFEEDEEKLYATIKTHASAGGDKTWIEKIAMELSLFKPYCQLDKNTKKYKGLKLTDTTYVKNIFSNKQNNIAYKEIAELDKTYKKYLGLISGSTAKTIATIAGTAVITIGTAGAAFAFAPAIAVGLVGGSFAGLSGAALTSASLAALGGGAVAVGGLGMAGGAMIIAGGGALVGLGASGATSAALTLLTSSSYVQDDYARLLTKCDKILLNKYQMKNEVINIQKQVETNLGEITTQLSVIKNSVDEKSQTKVEKERVKELEKSAKIIESSNKALIKLIDKEAK